jgi:hypothetical protein
LEVVGGRLRLIRIWTLQEGAFSIEYEKKSDSMNLGTEIIYQPRQRIRGLTRLAVIKEIYKKRSETGRIGLLARGRIL